MRRYWACCDDSGQPGGDRTAEVPRRLGAAAEVTRVGVLDQAEDVGVDHRRRYLIHERAA